MTRLIRRGIRLFLIVVMLLGTAAWIWLSRAGQRSAAPEMEASTPAFHRAADLLRAHQLADGHWPTLVTSGLVFEHPSSETNVFVPAIIVDLLEPVATETGLTDV